VHLQLAAALGLRGDIDEAKKEIAEAVKLKPDADSIARLRALSVTQGFGNPPYQALREKTVLAGLRRVGFPRIDHYRCQTAAIRFMERRTPIRDNP
jgi:adenylate cyclase